jgi:hypothetical protein
MCDQWATSIVFVAEGIKEAKYVQQYWWAYSELRGKLDSIKVGEELGRQKL